VDIIYLHRIASKDGQYVHVEELTNAMLEQGHNLRFIAPQFTDDSEFGSDGGFVSKLKDFAPFSKRIEFFSFLYKSIYLTDIL